MNHRLNSLVRPGSWNLREGATCRMKRLTGWGCLLVGVAALSPWRVGIVMGRSMEPTIRSGSLFFYQKEEQQQPFRKGDLIVLRFGAQTWIKRVYATGGQRFWVLKETRGEAPLLEPIRSDQVARFRRIVRSSRRHGRRDLSLVRYEVPAGTAFLVADGATGLDSRQIGPVPVSGIIGRVTSVPGARFLPMPNWIERSFPPRPGRQGLASAAPASAEEAAGLGMS